MITVFDIFLVNILGFLDVLKVEMLSYIKGKKVYFLIKLGGGGWENFDEVVEFKKLFLKYIVNWKYFS